MNNFFGSQLVVEVANLKKKVGEKEFYDLAARHGVRREMLRRYEDGNWSEISHSALFFLTALAEQHALEPFLHTLPSPIWKTFRDNSKQNRILIGADSHGHVVAADMKCAHAVIESDLRAKAPTAVTEKDHDSISHWMKTSNVLAVGGSKVNYATELALSTFVEAGGPKIRFLWPGYQRETAVSGASPSQNRILEIDSRRYEEDQSEGRALGAIAVCINPLESNGVTTIVISGCSRQATELMINHLDNPAFYRLYHPTWESKLDGKPIIFFFDSSATFPWRVIGAQKPRRKPGRRSGQKNSWPRRM